MADKVQDMHGVAHQPRLEPAACGRLQPLEDHLAVRHQAPQRRRDGLPLAFNVEGDVVAGVGQHGQDPQRRLDDEGRLGPGQRQVADDRPRFRQHEVLLMQGIEEDLPWQRRQRRGVVVKAQPDAQRLVGRRRFLLAGDQDAAHVVMEDGVVQLGAQAGEGLRVAGWFGGCSHLPAAARAPRLAR